MANENVATIQKKGERFYLKGLPFEQKDRAKSLGCKWDSTLRAWWTADLAVAEEVAGAKFEAKSDSNRNCVVDLSRVTNWGSAWELIYPALPQVIVDERAAAQRFERADARWKAANEIVATLHRAGLTGALLAEAQAVEERFRAEMQERDEKWRAAQRAVAAEVA